MSRSFVFAIVVIASVLPSGCTGRNSPPEKKNAISETNAAVSHLPKSDLGIGHTVCLTVREPEADGPEGGVAPMGVREIVRQAFLMAASDELGLPTRDCMLREGFPEKQDDASAPLSSCHSIDPANCEKIECVLTRRGAPEKVLWPVNYVPKQYPTLGMLPIDAEVWARKDLKEVLERAGFKGSVPPHRASSEVAQATYDLLWTWNEISVMAGLRSLHEELRREGRVAPKSWPRWPWGTLTWERWSSTTSAAPAKSTAPGASSINSGCRN